MLSELTITILRLGLLVLLWIFVFSTLAVLRRDLFGTRLLHRAASAGAGQAPKKSQLRPAKQPKQRSAPAQDSKRTPSHLTVIEGSMVGTRIDLTSAGVLIGRAPDCTLVLTDDYSSGKHLRLYADEHGRWFAEDLKSTNGTYIGNRRLTAPEPLHAGTQLRIGRTVLELRK